MARLIPLDPISLADRPAGRVFDPGSPYWAIAADGSTLVGLEYEDQRQAAGTVEIVVHDAATGAERRRIRPPLVVCCPHLSRDGRRLLTQDRGDGTPWALFDTATGQVLATVAAARPANWRTWLDPDLRRATLLLRPRPAGAPASQTRPWPDQLVAYDLMNGSEAGRLTLTTVLTGQWRAGRHFPDRGGELFSSLFPGGALAPDGRQLALVHADAEAVTLVDTHRLAVTRTLALTRPPSLPAPPPLPGWLESGRQAIFAVDGRHLYMTGYDAGVTDRSQSVARHRGLSLVDLDAGRIVAEALLNARIVTILPAPDGRSLYVSGPTDPEAGGPTPSWLRRLDAASLAVLAEREFTDFSQPLLLPTGRVIAPLPRLPSTGAGGGVARPAIEHGR